MKKFEGSAYFIGFIASIWFANWLLTHWGTTRFPGGPWLIPVWPAELTLSGAAIYAPSGVIAAGLSFTMRDLVQRRLGLRVAVVSVLVGAALSAALDPSLALASGLAFLLAELLDLCVYTPLQRRNLVGAVLASNMVGVAADSVVFLTIAFGSLALVEGQIIGKAWMTLVTLPLIYGLRELDKRRGLSPLSTTPAFP